MLLNYTPNKVSVTSPYEAIHGKAPDVTVLHPFGCRALWLDPHENKLKSKVSEAIYVGQSGGGHQLFNPATRRTITRRDVRFIEDDFPLLRGLTVVAVTARTSPR